MARRLLCVVPDLAGGIGEAVLALEFDGVKCRAECLVFGHAVEFRDGGSKTFSPDITGFVGAGSPHQRNSIWRRTALRSEGAVARQGRRRREQVAKSEHGLGIERRQVRCADDEGQSRVMICQAALRQQRAGRDPFHRRTATGRNLSGQELGLTAMIGGCSLAN